jgi:histidinol-phosphate aminotransferase
MSRSPDAPRPAESAHEIFEVRPGRRAFLTGAAVLAAAPILGEADFAFAAQTDVPSGMALHGQSSRVPPPGAVLINANENPLGPSKAAIDAIARVAPAGGRYDRTGEKEQLTALFARQSGLKEDHVEVYAGSGEPLHYTVLAYTGPGRSFVTADPSYEAGMRAAATSGAKVVKVPLTADFAHDVRAMVAADPAAGLIYICNPNNPTGTLTRAEDIAWLVENKPKGAVLLIDEAYIHLSEAPAAIGHVIAGKDVIILRTFSKIYGMAGIRCGFALGRPDLLARLKPFGQNPMPITGAAAARASLEDPGLIPARRKIIGDTRRATLAWLKASGFKVIGDPQTNCFMIDTGRDGKAVQAALRDKGVWIGRTWPVWPNAVRVSVGTDAEMAAFRTAFAEVMGRPATAMKTRPDRWAGLEAADGYPLA